MGCGLSLVSLIFPLAHKFSQFKLIPLPPHQKMTGQWIDWSKADWTLQDIEISEKLGVSQSAVWQRRRQIGAPNATNHRKHRGATSFRGVDWSKPDSVIAIELGVSHTRVYQVRKAVAAPPSPLHHQRLSTLQELERLKKNAGRLKGKTFGEVCAMLGRKGNRPLKGGLLHQFWKRHLEKPPVRHPWALMNFALPSTVLGRIWKMPPYLVNVQRRRKGLVRPRWRTNTSGLKRLKEYQAAVRAEGEKARRYLLRRIGQVLRA